MAVPPLVRLNLAIARRERLARKRQRVRVFSLVAATAATLLTLVAVAGVVPALDRAFPHVIPGVPGQGGTADVAVLQGVDATTRRALERACQAPWYLRSVARRPTHAEVVLGAQTDRFRLTAKVDCLTLTIAPSAPLT